MLGRWLALHVVCAAAYHSTIHARGAGDWARTAAAPVLLAAVPTELEDPAWLPELQACCSMAAAGEAAVAGDARMGKVLEWLQTMLVELELGQTEELDGTEEDELDEGFVSTARPWLHTKEFHDVACTGEFLPSLWGHVSTADYLQPGGEGGTLLLLLPASMPLSLFDQVTDAVRDGVHASLNGEVRVNGFHPDAPSKASKSPVPVLQIFLDTPELFVDGGSMGDAAGFL